MPSASSGGSQVGSAQIVDNEIVDADVNASANIALSKINAADQIDNAELADDFLNKVKVVVSAAEIIALNVTPKTLIAAPGASKVLVIDSILGVFKPGGTQFTGTGTDMMIREETSANTIVDNAFSAANMTGAAQVIKQMKHNIDGGHITLTANKGLYLTLLTSSLATGTGTLEFHINYRIVTI